MINAINGDVTGQPVSAPVQAPSTVVPQINPTLIPPTPVLPPSTGGSAKRKIVAVIIAGALILAILGGVAYAYMQQIGPFSVSQYTEDTFLSEILTKMGSINTASYNISAAIAVEQREQDAVPFVLSTQNPVLQKQYDNDVVRVSDVTKIINKLNALFGATSKYDSKTKKYVTVPGKNYPATLSVDLLKEAGVKGSVDPATNKPYEYKVTNNGKDFAITATFETSDAISSIRDSYTYVATSTIIVGQKVTFTKESGYFYIPLDLPKPFLASLADSLRALAPDVSGDVAIGATTDLRADGLPDWRFNATANGDMGDLTYQVDVEALKKDKDYYVRINKIPSIIPYVSNYKGQWIQILSSATASSSESYLNPFASIAESMAEVESEYKKNRAEFATGLKNLVLLVDKENLIVFKTTPMKETVGGRSLYRYQLDIRKEAIVPFYKQAIAEADKYKKLELTQDQGLLDYLQGKEFDEVFTYVKNNTHLTLWTDGDGLPAILEYKMRVVPPDTATQLKDKQISLVFKIVFTDINKPLTIEKPADAKPIEDIIKEVEKNIGTSSPPF